MLQLFIASGQASAPQVIPETIALYICVTIFALLILAVLYEYILGLYWQFKYAALARGVTYERKRKSAWDALISDPHYIVYVRCGDERLRMFPSRK